MGLHHLITYLLLSGTAFYGDLRIEFADGLNTPIGGCGVGKTGVLECLHFALGMEPARGREEQNASHLRKIIGGGRVELGVVTQHGVPYVLSRSLGEPPRVRDARGQLVAVDLAELFTAEVYSVSEILEIAGDAARQLPLSDKFEPALIRALGQRIAEVERRLVVNSAQIAKLDEELAENATREAELPSVAAALEAMTLAGPDPSQAARTRTAQERKVARGRERRAVAEMAKELGAARAAFEAVAKEALHRLARSVEGDLERGACGEAFGRAHAAVHRAAGAIEAAAGRVGAEVAAASSASGRRRPSRRSRAACGLRTWSRSSAPVTSMRSCARTSIAATSRRGPRRSSARCASIRGCTSFRPCSSATCRCSGSRPKPG